MDEIVNRALCDILVAFYMGKIKKYLAINNDENWITVNGNHILIKKGENPHKAVKRFELKNAIKNVLANKADEIVIKEVRNDLAQYGGDNSIAIIKGTNKGGALHFSEKHTEDIDGVIEALLDGEVTSHIPNRKIKIEKDGYVALLSLDYFGNKKTWLLTGYKETEKGS